MSSRHAASDALSIVTGHSRGLGAALAARLLEQGIPVLGLSRAGHPALAERFPERLREARLDLADTAALLDWLDQPQLAEALSGVERVFLINNAATLQPVGPLGTQDGATLARAVALNVAAPLLLCNAVAAASPAARERRLLHISSGAARTAYPGWSVYCASKAALDQHARACALDNLPGLRIASLAPGVIDTGMQAEIRSTPLQAFPLRPRFEALQREGQLSRPDDCARRVIDYLLDESFGQPEVADLRDR